MAARWTIHRRFAIHQARLQELAGLGPTVLFRAARVNTLMEHSFGLVLTSSSAVWHGAALLLQARTECVICDARAFHHTPATGHALVKSVLSLPRTEQATIGDFLTLLGETHAQDFVRLPCALRS